ncbi:hypothetical protein [Aeromonas phage 4L372D]|uniref:CapR homology domain-containing protein n=1 Tax=Aeromonas phage 4L372D TaxID=2588518 RepID=A0A5B9N550_9CAUD|nr:hypothetical protein HWC27_gp236 [Aeromonas phage 4L372D]QEG08619.1 hypothetical protein [Aeromonas phage 4L372D]
MGEIMEFVENKKKREKAEDFIGWKSEDGKLEVTGIAGKQGRISMFKVTCTECSKDPELFPDGYFISQKCHLVRGSKPCGCSKIPKWEDWQFLTLARRAAKDRFIVHGFAEEFKNAHTKLNLECLKDGHKWTASIHSVMKGQGCPKCAGNAKPAEQEALQKCIDICKEMNYDAIGFVDGYKSNKSCRFEYNCKTHGKQEVSYNNFVSHGTRCGGCAKEENIRRLREDGNGNGYYPERKDEQDFLYILNFNNKFIKVGRSFIVDKRIDALKYLSKIKKIYKLRVFTATHQEIYDYEQELHNELRERNFQYYVSWSTECFENDCQFILNDLLNNCRLKETNT